jgi:outer membrane protein assembly factor BamB
MPTTRGLRTSLGIPMLLAVGLALAASPRPEEAWPGLWGPSRDGTAPRDARLPRGAALQAREAWRRPIGSGFSAITLAGGRGFTAQQDGANDYAVAFDTSTGKEVWRARLGDTYRGHDGSRDGPASTPAVDGGSVFILSPRGVLFALEAGTGTVAWQRDLRQDVGAAEPFYGFGTSPLVSGRHVIVQTGGEKSGLVALDKATGATAWSVAHTKATGYSSPVAATLGGVPQVLVLANDILYGVRPEDGSLLWSHPTGWGEEAMRPPLALPGDRVLISGASEAKLIALARDGARFTARDVWKSPRLKNSLSPTVFHDGHLYGFSSQYLVCVDPENAEMVWREKVYAGSLILVDGHLMILGAESGELRVGRVSSIGYQERLKASVFNAGSTSVTGPAFAGGRVFMRNVEEIVALDVVG